MKIGLGHDTKSLLCVYDLLDEGGVSVNHWVEPIGKNR